MAYFGKFIKSNKFTRKFSIEIFREMRQTDNLLPYLSLKSIVSNELHKLRRTPIRVYAFLSAQICYLK